MSSRPITVSERVTVPAAMPKKTTATSTRVTISRSMIWAIARVPSPAIWKSNETRSGVATTRSVSESGRSMPDRLCPNPISLLPSKGERGERMKNDLVSQAAISRRVDWLAMRSEEFVALRREDWNRLEDLLARAGAGHLNALAPAQVLKMAALYRRATADLARAQRDWPGEPVHRYLNGLVGRGHGVVYRRGGKVWKRIRGFYVETLPRTYRRSWPFLLASAALLFVPALVSFFIVLAQPDAAYAIASPRLIDQVHHHQLWTNIPQDERVQAAGLIMVNNIYVVILAFG